MATFYLDSSACVKYFHEEMGSAAIQAIFADATAQKLISRLGAVEIVSAIAMKARSREIESGAVANARNRLYSEISDDNLAVLRVLTRHYMAAEQFLIKYATQMRLRAADALQLAVAADLIRSRGEGTFVCADRALIQVATLEGLTCLDPLAPPDLQSP